MIKKEIIGAYSYVTKCENCKEEKEESILSSKSNIIALTGKSGSGKSTILKEFTQNYFPRIFPIIQATTRPRRFPSESGYLFYDNEEWDKLEKQGAFLETTVFNNWHYGTLISSLALGSDNWNIGIFSPSAIE